MGLRIDPIRRTKRAFRPEIGPVHAVASLAEFWGVNAAAPGFSRVLDEKLAAAGLAGSAAPRAAAQPAGPTAWQPWFGGLGPEVGTPTSPAFAHAYKHAAATPRPTPMPTRGAPEGDLREPTRTPLRPLRITTDRQRAALATLQTLGAADLGPTSADVDLKRSFRQLARRYHPDTRPDLAADERRRLARLFAEACAAYRFLLESAL